MFPQTFLFDTASPLMKSTSRQFLKSILALAIVAPSLALFGQGAEQVRKRQHPALDRLKSLEGVWAGPATWDQAGKKGKVDFKLIYKTTSGGTAVMETMFPGTPGEMVTMYYSEGEDFVLVHYCSAGNQPRMKLEPSKDPNELMFRCTGGTNMTEQDSHMHSARLTIIGADQIKGAWSSTKEGKVEWAAEAVLVRQK
jgi:hypothetical protein